MPSKCQSICGDSINVTSDQCDDGNSRSGDGCNAYCNVEIGWLCTPEPSPVAPPTRRGAVGEGGYNEMAAAGTESIAPATSGWLGGEGGEVVGERVLRREVA